MKIFLSSTVAVLLVPSIAIAQTHCMKDEIEYFSCATTAQNKVVSVCGNLGKEGISNDSWLQYRFGKIGDIELTYPNEKGGSVKKFEGNYFAKYGAVSLVFISGNALYTVESSESLTGVSVTLSNGKHIAVACRPSNNGSQSHAGQPRQDSFMLLVNDLQDYNGQTDLQSQFASKYLK